MTYKGHLGEALFCTHVSLFDLRVVLRSGLIAGAQRANEIFLSFRTIKFIMLLSL